MPRLAQSSIVGFGTRKRSVTSAAVMTSVAVSGLVIGSPLCTAVPRS